MVGEEPQQSNVDANKATVTRRCFRWVRDINLRVRFLIISILSCIDLTTVPVAVDIVIYCCENLSLVH